MSKEKITILKTTSVGASSIPMEIIIDTSKAHQISLEKKDKKGQKIIDKHFAKIANGAFNK